MLELFGFDCDWLGFAHKLIPVTLRNLIGGFGLVGSVYWVIYRIVRAQGSEVNRQTIDSEDSTPRLTSATMSHHAHTKI